MRRGNRREGISNDHYEREAKWRGCNSESWENQERGEEGRVLVEVDIEKSYIMMGVRKVLLVAIRYPRVANKYTFKSVRGEFG